MQVLPIRRQSRCKSRKAIASESDPLTGEIIDGRYEVEASSASGMGKVYGVLHRASANASPQDDAPDLAQQGDLAARFIRKLARRALGHPNIVRFRFWTDPRGGPYFVMSCSTAATLQAAAPGRAAAHRLFGARPFPVAAGLGAAHAAGVIHRISTGQYHVTGGET